MVVLITGGASGIGSDITTHLLDLGHTVYLNYLSSETNALKIKDTYSNQVVLVPGNITDEDYAKNVMAQIKNEQGHLDLLINNACYCGDDLISDKTKDSFVKELDTNLVAPFLLTKYYHDVFDQGKIINLLSTDGVDTYNEYNVGYAASKAGLLNLTKSLAYSLKNFKVYGLMLNYVDTDSVRAMNPDYLNSELKRINQQELIKISTVINHLDSLITNDLETGYIERVDNNE